MNSEKISYCLVAAIFLGASIFTMLTCKSCSPFVEYENSLNLKQKLVYKQVVSERQSNYIKGLVLGSVIALFYLYFNLGTINPLRHACIFVAIALFVQYLYYNLVPKSIYMLEVLNTPDQVKKWLEVYKTMKMRYHIGMLLGLIGYFIFAYGIFKR